MVTRTIENYELSQDYGLLYDLALKSSIVCVADYSDCRDVAQTIANDHGYVHISCRGVCYADGVDRKDFIAQCKRANIAFILPTKTTTP